VIEQMKGDNPCRIAGNLFWEIMLDAQMQSDNLRRIACDLFRVNTGECGQKRGCDSMAADKQVQQTHMVDPTIAGAPAHQPTSPPEVVDGFGRDQGGPTRRSCNIILKMERGGLSTELHIKAHGCDSMAATKVPLMIAGTPANCRPPAHQPAHPPPQAVGFVCDQIPQNLTIGQNPGSTLTYEKMMGDIPVWKSIDWQVKHGGLALYLFKVTTGDFVIAYGCDSMAAAKDVQPAQLVAVYSCGECALVTGPHRWKLLDLPKDAVVRDGAGVIKWTTVVAR